MKILKKVVKLILFISLLVLENLTEGEK